MLLLAGSCALITRPPVPAPASAPAVVAGDAHAGVTPSASSGGAPASAGISPSPSEAAATPSSSAAPATAGATAPCGSLATAAPGQSAAHPTGDDEDEERADDAEGADDDGAGDGEGEAEADLHDASGAPADGSPRFSADVSDAELERLFVNDLPALGSISVGFADAGRLINSVQLTTGDAWEIIVPTYAWGTQETIDGITLAANAVRARFANAPPLRVNHISKKDGGYLRPHKSHQAGRDVDLGLFYRSDIDYTAIRGRREQLIDPAMNWELIRALVINTDVQVVLVDRRIQKVIYDYALAHGEDKAWLDTIFFSGSALVQHARGHRDHFHVRFFSPRSQELGRRVQPLLAKRPDENITMYRVRSGDTLGHIARRYDTTVRLIQQANGMHNSFLRVGRTLAVPLRGPCTQCPLPPPVVVPPRRLPPAVATASAAGTASSSAPSQPCPEATASFGGGALANETATVGAAPETPEAAVQSDATPRPNSDPAVTN